MCDIFKIIDIIGNDRPHVLVAPGGQPELESVSLKIPHDVASFYNLCGGAVLHKGTDREIEILDPKSVNSSNQVMLDLTEGDDISFGWYVIAKDNTGEYISIDFNTQRLGYCYDSFSETHGLVGDTPVIAMDFTQFLWGCLYVDGALPYWQMPEFEPIADAYD